MILFFDTETTGKAKDWNASLDNLDNWPRLVQLGFLLYDYNGNELGKGNYLIRPNGFTIPNEATAVHGITTEMATKNGLPLELVNRIFYYLLKFSDCLVAHNFQYDAAVVGAEFIRGTIPNILQQKRTICTMQASMDVCKLPGKYGDYKWPSLKELHTHLFGHEFEGAHDAFSDIQATAKCFWELKSRGVIELQPSIIAE